MEQRARTRFFDVRSDYLAFVGATTEKAAVTERIAREVPRLDPGLPILRVFDAGMGDATVLAGAMRHLQATHSRVPWLVVGKEISPENVVLSLAVLSDLFDEHPDLVFAATNMTYREAPALQPRPEGPLVSWRRTALRGSATAELSRQVQAIADRIVEDWWLTTSPRTGNPVYVRPAVHVIHRKDREGRLRGVLSSILHRGSYDLIIASQPYRSRTTAHHKVRTVIGPLARALAPGGRLLAIHSYGDDPGMEIIHTIWPGERPFPVGRRAVLAEASRQLSESGDTGLQFHDADDEDSVFRYSMRAAPDGPGGIIAPSFIRAAWDAAVYVAQIEEERAAKVVASGAYVAPTRSVIERHGGVWFNNESYVISRKRR